MGRDVLAGCLLCATTTGIGRLLWFVPQWLGYPPTQPFGGSAWQFLGARPIIANISNLFIGAPIFWLAALFVLVLLRALLRKEWAAAVVWVLLFTVFSTAHDQFSAVDLVATLLFFAPAVFCLIRFGLLALVANFILRSLLTTFPLTTQGSAWYAGISLAGILLMAAMALYGYTALGGRRIFGSGVLDE